MNTLGTMTISISSTPKYWPKLVRPDHMKGPQCRVTEVLTKFFHEGG